ncbi:MAG: hypothetical protein ACD_19C00275G0004, partial [uncultured bacterium]
MGNNKRALVISYFPRSIRYEGIRKIALSRYRKLEKQGFQPTLIVPIKGDVPKNISHIYMFTKPPLLGFIFIIIKMMITVSRLQDKSITICCLENSLATPFMTVWLRLTRFRGNIVTHFLCPIQSAGEISKNLFRYKERQMITHLFLNNFVLAWISSLFMDKNIKFIVGSRYQKEQLEKFGIKAKVTNPYQISKVNKNTKKFLAPEKVGYLGHFSSIKGVDLLILAFEKSTEDIPNLELHIAWSGLGGESKKIIKMINQQEHKNRIKLHGIVNPIKFIQHLDLLVLPYKLNSVPIPPAVL